MVGFQTMLCRPAIECMTSNEMCCVKSFSQPFRRYIHISSYQAHSVGCHQSELGFPIAKQHKR